jgi:hypothetical protein
MKTMLVLPPARWDDNELDRLVTAANPVDAGVLARVSTQSLAELRERIAGELPGCRRGSRVSIARAALQVRADQWMGVSRSRPSLGHEQGRREERVIRNLENTCLVLYVDADNLQALVMQLAAAHFTVARTGQARRIPARSSRRCPCAPSRR